MRQLNRVPRDRRSLAALSMMLAGAFVFVGILAAIVVGADKAIYWAGTYLLPVAALLGAVLVILALLVGLAKRLPKGYDISDWWQ